VIVSVLFLIGLFLCISAYLILTGLNFIGLSYLLVYIGAVKNRMVRSLKSNWAAWVIIPLYKVLLIINNFLFKPMLYKNKLPSLKVKWGARLAFAYILASYFEYSKYVEKIKQRKLHYSQKSFSNHSEEFIK